MLQVYNKDKTTIEHDLLELWILFTNFRMISMFETE